MDMQRFILTCLLTQAVIVQKRKVIVKALCHFFADDSSSYGKVEELMLILKWGGVLTHAGRQQAENLGSFFRTAMYPR